MNLVAELLNQVNTMKKHTLSIGLFEDCLAAFQVKQTLIGFNAGGPSPGI